MFPLCHGIFGRLVSGGGGAPFCLTPTSYNNIVTPVDVSDNDGIRKSVLGMSSTDIAYTKLPSRVLNRYRISGSVLSPIGTGITLDYNTDTQMARLSETRLVYINDLDYQLETVEWDEGTLSWSFVVSTFGAISGGNGFTNSIAALSETKVVMFNNTTDTFQVYESVSDSAWTLIAESGIQPLTYASTYSSNGLLHVVDENTFMACGASGGDTMRTFTISGSVVSQTGDTLTTLPGSNKVIATMVGNSGAFALSYGSSGSRLSIYCAEPSTPSITAQPVDYTINANTSEYRALSNLPGTNYFAYIGSTEETIRVIEVVA